MSSIARAALLAPLLAPLCLAQDESVDAEPFVAFSRELEQTVLLGDASFFRKSLDFDALLATVTEGVEVEESFFAAFSKGIRSSFNFAEQVVAGLETGDGTYTFLKLLPDERALFRLAGDTGLNYHELFLRRGADGSVSIVDVYVYASGERVTETMRRPYLAAAASVNRGILARLLEKESAYVEALPRIQEMIQLAQQDPAAALKVCESLPESVRTQPEILLVRSQIAAQVSDEAYLAALEDFSKHQPDSPALDLMLIDFHILRQEFDQALKRIDAVDERVGGDAYLDVLRGNVLWQAGRLDAAKKAANSARERDARLEYEVLWLLLDLALEQKDHAATLELMVALEEDYGVEWMDLSDIETYAAFVASPEYQQWKARAQSDEGDQDG